MSFRRRRLKFSRVNRVGFGGKIIEWRHDQMVEFGLSELCVARGPHNWVYCCLLVDDDDDASQQEQWTLFSLQHFALHRMDRSANKQTGRQTDRVRKWMCEAHEIEVFYYYLVTCWWWWFLLLFWFRWTGAFGSGTLHWSSWIMELLESKILIVQATGRYAPLWWAYSRTGEMWRFISWWVMWF